MRLKAKLLAVAAVACALALPAGGQGVPTIDVTSLAKLADQLVEAKLQLKEQIAQNVKLDEQTRQLFQQITLLQDQIAALRNGLTLADLGVDPDSFLRDILPDFADLTASVDAARSGDWTRVLASATPSGAAAEPLPAMWTALSRRRACRGTAWTRWHKARIRAHPASASRPTSTPS